VADHLGGVERGAVPSLPRRFRPLGVRVAAAAFAVVLVGTTAVIWLAFSDDIREQFTPVQKATVLAIGLAIFAVGHALVRCRIDADEAGLTVVNGYRDRRFAWAQVVDVTLRPGSPWAVLDLTDGTSQSALGIQGSDGGRAQRQVRDLRALVDAHAGAEPPSAAEDDESDGPAGGDQPLT